MTALLNQIKQILRQLFVCLCNNYDQHTSCLELFKLEVIPEARQLMDH